MVRGIIPICIMLSFIMPAALAAGQVVHPNGIDICSQIIQEMTDGRIGIQKAREISLAIGNAGNRHFGKVTCGDMWLYMAIVYVESGFKNNVINEQNCRGMFQVHAPSWAGKFGIRYSDLLDTQTNADAGISVFKYYLQLYRNIVAALSAYNSDDPRAAISYARAVLHARQKIKKRYTQIYRQLKNDMIASEIQTPDQK
ncbi:MAG: lytic transglycosylase domain-containing protein [Desulfomonile tiedjei]|uniref:Lytic transglycosylase domain-containing protein n=1 Tax=Desulfomonile tiedjei TaxID=2358 RepID=A0A9D6V3C9_9BACT|nr:lytic transglycosylase domain-containing protein [Desulfomonile tiedjei]